MTEVRFRQCDKCKCKINVPQYTAVHINDFNSKEHDLDLCDPCWNAQRAVWGLE